MHMYPGREGRKNPPKYLLSNHVCCASVSPQQSIKVNKKIIICNRGNAVKQQKERGEAGQNKKTNKKRIGTQENPNPKTMTPTE